MCQIVSMALAGRDIVEVVSDGSASGLHYQTSIQEGQLC